jgi:hypothetical protein
VASPADGTVVYVKRVEPGRHEEDGTLVVMSRVL